MLMNKYMIPFAAMLVASPISAQMGGADASLTGVKGLYETVRGFITKAADQMPEANYSFKPTPEVRSFGELVGHVANASHMFCAAALGEKPMASGNAEKLATKAEIVAALKVGFAACDKAYAMDASKAGDKLDFFGQPHTRLSVLAFNMGHDFEHYGNIVTYMRLKGMVPPSSAGGN
jgi:uncharacterized damage-inducible protein DinB